MKKLLLSCAFLAFAFTVSAQDLPDNPEPGKCYVRCKTPDVWKNEEVTIETAAAYKKITTHPAQFRKETEKGLPPPLSSLSEIIFCCISINKVNPLSGKNVKL